MIAAQSVDFFDFVELQFNETSLQKPFDFALRFNTTGEISPSELIIIDLPRFSQRIRANQSAASNITFENLLISPSHLFSAR